MHTLVNGGTRDKCQWVYLGFHRIQTALQENEAGNTTTISFLSLSLSFFFLWRSGVRRNLIFMKAFYKRVSNKIHLLKM